MLLTCRAEKRQREVLYYSAYWRDNRIAKKPLKKKYIGKAEAITPEKLEAIASDFANSEIG